MTLELKFPGVIPVPCSGGCGWDVLVDIADPRLPDGPYTCVACDPKSNKPCDAVGCTIATQHGHTEVDADGNVIGIFFYGPANPN